ncbi:hypothetical protein ABNF97_21955 [Plantactinospora sp. B6F1]|uniref:hypothetical protein n=1 Tax=Plantactinospora sp. B6F1 TaxID=3158971 RepID=UPI0032D95D81
MTRFRRRVPLRSVTLTSLVAVALLSTLVAGCGVRPSVVISGNPAPVGPVRGVGLFFVAEDRLALVLRPSTPPDSVASTLALLLAGPSPTEREQGYRTELPADAGPATVTRSDRSGTTVRLGTDVTGLSAAAVDQIVCTVRYALPVGGPVDRSFITVTVTGPDGSRESRGCAAMDCPDQTEAVPQDLSGPVRCPPPGLRPAIPWITPSDN